MADSLPSRAELELGPPQDVAEGALEAAPGGALHPVLETHVTGGLRAGAVSSAPVGHLSAGCQPGREGVPNTLAPGAEVAVME